MSKPDIEEGAREQWVRHPITSKYRKDAIESRDAAMLCLKNAAIDSTDPKVRATYAIFAGLENFVEALSPKEAPDA